MQQTKKKNRREKDGAGIKLYGRVNIFFASLYKKKMNKTQNAEIFFFLNLVVETLVLFSCDDELLR
jgi:hypothetical protein